jgi:hypothetical protein
MTLAELRAETEKDMAIDRSELGNESLRIPQLHNKYLNYFHDARIRYKILRQKYAELKKIKWEYYSGKLSAQELLDYNLPPFPHRILKTDLDKYLDSDKELSQIVSKMNLEEEKIAYLESIVKAISARHWQIRNAIDYLKFTNGIV